MKNGLSVSIVVPVYNEEEGILDFHERLLQPNIVKVASASYEIIYVDDGSTDNTLKVITRLATDNNAIKIISFSRNFGKEIATSAGIEFATGNAIIMMDSDGQHPPKLIGEFIEKWQAGAQVVVGVRTSNQKEGVIKKWGSKLFYRLFNSADGMQMTPGSTDYRLIDKAVQQEFIRLPEHNRITRGLIDWLGFKRDYIYFDAPARLAGTASYSSTKLVKLAVNSFISLSLKPLFLMAWLGFFITLLSLAAGTFMLIEQVMLNDPLGLNFTGAALLGIFISFLVGLVLTSQGVSAIYLSHIHTHTQNRPLYIVDYSQSVGI